MEYQIGFSWDGNKRATVVLKEEASEWLGGKGAFVHLAIQGRKARVIAAPGLSGRKSTLLEQKLSKEWPFKMTSNVAKGQLSGWPQGITVLPATADLNDEDIPMLSFEIPSNLTVSEYCKEKSQEELCEELAELLDTMRARGMTVSAIVERTEVKVIEERF